MLVLTRKKHEAVILEDLDGNEIGRVRVTDGSGRIRLGFEMPPHIRIRREEAATEPEPAAA